MRKHFYPAAIFVALITCLAMFDAGLAQTEPGASAEAADISSAAADFDNTLGAEILGVEDPDMLPTSPFYFLKNWGRSLGTALTFSAEGKAEKKLQYASERLAEARAMLQETDKEDSRQNAKIKETLQKHRQDIEYAQEKIASVKSRGDVYDKLLEKSAAKYAAFAKVMAPDEDLALDIDKDIVAEIYKSKEQVLSDLGGLISRLDDPAAKLEEILQGQPGSEFKEFRNLEVLGELADKAPEKAGEAIMAAQERIRGRMEEKLANAAEGKGGEEFANYVMSLRGNQAGHMAILDQLSKSTDIPDEVADGFRRAKDAAAVNFSIKMIDHPASKEMVEAIASGDIDKLRVLEEMADALPEDSEVKDELENARAKAIDRAAGKIGALDNLDDKINFLIKDGVPDAKSFVLLDEIQAKFGPERQEEVKAIRNKAFEVFSEVIDSEENQEKLLDRLASDSPKDTAVIATIKKYLPAGSAPSFDKLIAKQLEKAEKRIVDEENVEKLIKLRSELDSSPEAQEAMEKYAPGMTEKMNQAQFEKAEKMFAGIDDPVKMVGAFNMYNGILEKHPEVEAKLREKNPELIERMVEDKAEKIEAYLDRIENRENMEKTIADMEDAGLDKFKDKAPQKIKLRLEEKIRNRYEEVSKEDFMEKVREQMGADFDETMAGKMFGDNISPLFRSGDKPDEEMIAGIRTRMEEQIMNMAETEAQKRAEAQKEDMAGQFQPSPEEIEKMQQEQMQEMMPKEPPPSGEGAYMPPKEGGYLPPKDGSMTGPTPEEIEKIKQEQMQEMMPKEPLPLKEEGVDYSGMGPSPEEIEKIKQEQMQEMMPPQ